MTYKWHHIIWMLPVLASTYNSGSYSNGLYGAGATPTPLPVPITIGPITLPFTLPVTGAGLTLIGAMIIAAAMGLLCWMHQVRKNKRDS